MLRKNVGPALGKRERETEFAGPERPAKVFAAVRKNPQRRNLDDSYGPARGAFTFAPATIPPSSHWTAVE